MLAHRVERRDVGPRPQEETERFRLLFHRDPRGRRGQHGGTAARHEGDHEVPFPGAFQKRQDLARRREAEDVGDRVPGRRESHRARRPFRAARYGDHPARDAFPQRRESRLPHRPSRLSGPDEVDLPQGRKGDRRPDARGVEHDGIPFHAQRGRDEARRVDAVDRGAESAEQPILLRRAHAVIGLYSTFTPSFFAM